MNLIARCGIPSVRELLFGANLVTSLREAFAAGLAFQLRKHGLTQIEFAKKISVTQASVSRWVNRKEVPSATKVDEIAALFKVHPAILFMSEGDVAALAGDGRVLLDLAKLASDSGFRLTLM